MFTWPTHTSVRTTTGHIPHTAYTLCDATASHDQVAQHPRAHAHDQAAAQARAYVGHTQPRVRLARMPVAGVRQLVRELPRATDAGNHANVAAVGPPQSGFQTATCADG